jgi:hypothetical protein
VKHGRKILKIDRASVQAIPNCTDRGCHLVVLCP